ncbi:S9 family peptidase [Deinococcus aquiradiocola]|nr:S9 family peptidase [Deinococcus aquiradiocola]
MSSAPLPSSPAAPSTLAARPESLYALQFPSDPQLSPDGTRVAFVLTSIRPETPDTASTPDTAGTVSTTGTPDPERPRYFSAVHVSDGGAPRPLTAGDARDSSPRWSPDGTQLAFLSDRSGRPQLYLLPLAGGEARQITRYATGVSSPAWSPDGRYLSFLTRADAVDRRDELGEARVVTSVLYRANGSGMTPPAPAALYLHDLQKGTTRPWHAPERDIDDLVWLPGTQGALLVSSATQDDAIHWRRDVFRLPLPDGDAPATPTQVTRWAAPIGQLAVHPDGQRFAGVGRPPGSINTHDAHVYLFGPDGTGTRLDPDWDRPAGNIVAGDLHVGRFPTRPVWRDDATLTVTYTVGGTAGLYDVTLAGTVTPRLHDPHGAVTAFTAHGEHLAHISESAARPTEVHLNGTRITRHGEHLPFTPAEPRRVTFQTEDGEGEGWILLPPGEDRVPALLNIHGGPHTAYGYGFMHEFQLFAQAGYGVCYSNPRGSVGYGQAWSEAIHGRWGTVDRADLEAFFDACLQQEPRLDAARTGVMGGSYGGYMTNLITSRTTRFQVAVTDRSICNLISFGGTSDIGMRFWDDELGGNFHRRDDVDRLWAMSPLRDVQDVRTPTLVIHSLQDLRCPIEQAEQWFAALQLHGIESRFVRFPDEDHELSRSGRPDRRVKRLQEYLDWIARHLP